VTADNTAWPFPRPPRPPGRLLDISPRYAQLRARQPAARIALPDGTPAWLITRHQDVRAALADHRLSASTDPLHRDAGDSAGRIGTLAHTDPPQHARYRSPLNRAFGASRVRALQPRIKQIIGEQLDQMAACGPPADLMTSFAVPVPLRVICEVLGVPYRDQHALRLAADRMLTLGLAPSDVRPIAASMLSRMREAVSAKRRDSAKDLLTELTGAGELTDAEIADLAATLILGGYETLAASIGAAVAALIAQPRAIRAFADDAYRAERATEELLRYTSVVQYGVDRIAAHGLVLGGQHIQAGDRVIAFLPAANRDTALCPDPEALDTSRAPVPHVAFGHGVHQCVGQQLARTELRLAISSLFRRFPDLQLAVSPVQIALRHDKIFAGLDSLPVTWHKVNLAEEPPSVP
jgi:nocardicin N-oxygenase